MAQIFNGSVYGGSPGISTTVNYEYVRDGANMKYHFWGNTRLSSSTGWYYNNVRVKLYLNGSDIYTKDCKSSSKGWSIDWDAGWHTVSNKTSGTTPFYFTVKDTQNSGWCNYTSNTYQLDVAPAYTSITGFSVGALSETSVRFNWSAANTVDYVWYSTNNGSSWTGVDVADGTSGSFDVGGLAANTGYNFKIRVRRKDSQLTTDSGSYYAATYAYPYLTSVPEFTVGNNLTIGIYNPLGRSCTISVIGDNGVEHNGGTITGTSISPFNNDSWKNIWYSTLPSKTQGTYKARLVCSIGNVNQVSSAVKYYLDTSDSGFKPSFTANEIINIVNTANTAIAGSNKFIKNHNSLSGVIKPMTAKRSASGNYYNVSASGLSTVKKDYSSSNINFVLGNMSTNTFNVTAVDSRGFTTTVSKTIDLVDYNEPSVTSYKITRQNGIGTKAILSFSGKYTNWSGLLKTNAIQSIKYKIGSSGSWTALPSDATLTSSNGTWTLNAILTNDFAVTSQYDLCLQITDLLETVTTSAYTISTADAFVWRDLSNKYFGIRKKPTKTLDVAGDIGSDGDIYSRGGCQQQSKYNLSLSGLSTSNFYPVTFEGLDRLLDCEIMSQGASASAAYNQNHIHYRLLSRGWSDTPVLFTIMEYGLYNDKEITIGCIGKGHSATNHSVVWLRGGLTYTIWANQKPTLHTSDWDNDSAHSGSKFTVGTNLYGGTNVRTTILFTPQSTIKQGAYFNRGIKIPVDSIYPVGSIYLSATPTNPSTIFGGTWTQLKNHFLFATNDTSGNKGKDAVSSHTGTAVTGTAISVDQMPSHNHGGATGGAGGHNHEVFVNGDTNFPLITYPGWNGGQRGQGANVQTTYNGFRTYTGSTANHTHSVTAQGGGKTHNHSVPYIEVYVWQRTA